MSNNLCKTPEELFSAVEVGGEERATQAYTAIRRRTRDEANERIPLKVAPFIDIVRCSGCGRCVAACPQRIITLETVGYRKHAVLTRPEHCTGCAACLNACPLGAIAMIPFSP